MSDSSTPTHPIYLETVRAPTNIAIIKYWGKASIPLNTPINSSNSITLSSSDLCAVTTASASRSFTTDRLWLNGQEVPDASTSKRFRACVDGVKQLASDRIDAQTGTVLVSRDEWADMKVHISSYNTFPTAAGLASSAAGYAALVSALARLCCARETFPGELSTIARQGSGSACRSMYGGFVAWRMGGEREDGKDSLAEQICDENHWPEIRALILVVSDRKKGTSSTAGMGTSVATSEFLKQRAQTVVPARLIECENAFRERDFDTFGRLAMVDSNSFHATCLDTYPPIFYTNDVSKTIIRLVHAYNEWAGEIRAAYTFDAGPNAVLYTLEKHAVELGALMMRFYPPAAVSTENYVSDPVYAGEVAKFVLDEGLVAAAEKTGRVPEKGDVKNIYFTKSGPGPESLGPEMAVIDKETGLNTYCPT